LLKPNNKTFPDEVLKHNYKNKSQKSISDQSNIKEAKLWGQKKTQVHEKKL
jgi:hypothetical protein